MKNYFTQEDDKLKWTQKNKDILLKTVVFDVTQRDNVASDGTTGKYIVLDARDWAITIAEKDDNFLMVKQWRHGEQKLSVEFPGGVIEKNEAPEVAARRELAEETGFTAGKLVKLGSVNPNPALFSNHVHVFLASDLQGSGKQQLDNDEFVNFVEIPKTEVLHAMGTEQFQHGLMSAALFLYLRYKKNY